MNAIAVSEDSRTLTHLSTRAGSDPKQISSEAQDVAESLSNLLLATNSRKVIDGTSGKWLTVKKPEAVFLALVASRYSERVGYQALEEAWGIFSGFLINQDASGLNFQLQSLLERYNSPESLDKLALANQRVDDLTLGVRRNLDTLIANDGNLNELDENARRLHAEAAAFNKNANTLKRTLWWKNVWFWVIVALVVAGVIVLVVLLAKLT